MYIYVVLSRFRGPIFRDMHPRFMQDPGHRPFSAGPLPPNFPPPHMRKCYLYLVSVLNRGDAK